MVSKESDGTLLYFQDHRLLHRAEHIVGLFSWSVFIVGIPIMPASESMRMDTKLHRKWRQ